MYLYDNDDEEPTFPAYNNSSGRDDILRSISTESSAGRFVPNLNPSSSSYDQLPHEENPLASPPGKKLRPRAATYAGELHRPNLTAITKSDSTGSSGRRSVTSPLSIGSPDQSPYNSPRNHVDVKETRGKPCTRTDSQNSTDTSSSSVPPSSPTENKDMVFPDTPGLNLDESGRAKLKERRPRSERRYHTADAIQDLKAKKDPSIHKRLSWNFGTTAVDINIEEQRAGSRLGLSNKAFSSDSLRSALSSSGVSSTGSLHMSPEKELSEMAEIDVPVIGMKNSLSDMQFQNLQEQDECNERSEYCDNEDDRLLKSLSGSVPNISHLDLRDGSGGDARRHMTHAQIMRMKKHLLLNSTLEAS